MEPVAQTAANSATQAVTSKPKRSWKARLFWSFVILLFIGFAGWMWYWDFYPVAFDPVARAQIVAKEKGERVVVGYTSVTAEVDLLHALLDKRGGYLSNDMLPPGVLMDNVPNWEFGVLVQARDFSTALRDNFSRSQTQSVEDKDLIEAQPLLASPNDRWLLPSSEAQYSDALKHFENYRKRLADADAYDGQFFARADNLADWLGAMSRRLGSLSQRLSASVGQVRIDTNLANSSGAQQSTPTEALQMVKTPWRQIDDVFYEARGATWAMAQLLKAAELDFSPVLENKNARTSYQQIIRELEEAQAPIRSPIILNGSQYGFFANHSLVMANYVSRANAALIDLQKLLKNG